MINLISGILEWVLSPLLSLFDFPVLPPEVATLLDTLFSYMRGAMGLFNFFCPIRTIKPAIDVFLAVYIIKHTYQIVMWVLKKIPMIGVE